MGIYKISNKISGKKYIGQSIDIERRQRDHLCELRGNKHYNTHLQRSWNKYGEDAFEFSVIKVVDSSDLLDEYEIKYIKLYNSHWGGYNRNDGGAGGGRGKVYTEDEKKRCRVKSVVQFDTDGNILGKYYSTAYAEKITGVNKETIRKVCQENNKAFSAGGYVWMYEDIFNRDGFDHDFYCTYKIVKCNKNVAMVCVKDKSIKIFESIKDASLKTGINKNLIESLCDENKTSHKTTNGYAFCYKDYFDEVGMEEFLKQRKKKNRGIPVIQIDKNTFEKIATFKSAAEAERCLGINSRHISACVSGNRKTAGGFAWMFEKEGRGDLGGKKD